MALDFFAPAPRNLGGLLAEELERLGVRPAVEARGGARFRGTLADGYRACLWSRVASRVLLILAHGPADGPDALYDLALDLPWEEHLSQEGTFAVRFEGELPGIDNRQFAALRVKDAVADRFTRRLGRRPSVDPQAPDLWIWCYGQADGQSGNVALSLDLSGSALHRRGWRERAVAAPLKENLAAAILLRAGWPDLAAAGGALLDPLCGSGTLAIEGALMAADIAPGLLRAEGSAAGPGGGAGRFGAAAWLGHDARLWAELLTEARIRREAGLARLGSVRACDADPRAVRIAADNAGRAGLARRVRFERAELQDMAPAPGEETGLVVANPPYGERLGADSDLPGLYAALGRVLRERFAGWRAAVFTGNPDLGKHMGLRARRLHSLYNGPIECRLLHFEVDPEHFVSNRPRPLPESERGPGADMLANRLVKNRKALRKWRETEQVGCYRLYDADLPEYNLALDIYQGTEREDGRLWAVVQEYEAPASVEPQAARRRLREALGVIPEVLEIPQDQVHFRIRRRQKGGAQYDRLADTQCFREVAEGGHRFLVNFEDYLDTGLFLDHRITRRLIGEWAQGRRFLNLFGYTGTATVYAARGGAIATTTVDMSATYLEWAWENFKANGIDGMGHELVQANCIQWLHQVAGRRRFGLIFLDTPSFSTSKRMDGTLDVQRDHVPLIRAAAALLEPGGTLLFSTNLRRFRLDCDGLADFEIEDLSARTLPRDFARNPRIHSCFRIRFKNL